MNVGFPCSLTVLDWRPDAAQLPLRYTVQCSKPLAINEIFIHALSGHEEIQRQSKRNKSKEGEKSASLKHSRVFSLEN